METVRAPSVSPPSWVGAGVEGLEATGLGVGLGVGLGAGSGIVDAAPMLDLLEQL